MRLIASGCSNAQVGTALFLSENTVKSHLRRIMTKVGGCNRAHVTGIVELTSMSEVLRAEAMEAPSGPAGEAWLTASRLCEQRAAALRCSPFPGTRGDGS